MSCGNYWRLHRPCSVILTKHKQWVSYNNECFHQQQICLWRSSQSGRGRHAFCCCGGGNSDNFFQIDNHFCISEKFNRPPLHSPSDLLWSCYSYCNAFIPGSWEVHESPISNTKKYIATLNLHVLEVAQLIWVNEHPFPEYCHPSNRLRILDLSVCVYDFNPSVRNKWD